MLAITNSIERRAVRQIFMWLPNYTFWVECVECLRLTEETNALATKNMWWRRRWRRWWWWWWAPITKPPRNSKRDKANEKICLTIVCHLIHRSFLSGHQLCVLCVCVWRSIELNGHTLFELEYFVAAGDANNNENSLSLAYTNPRTSYVHTHSYRCHQQALKSNARRDENKHKTEENKNEYPTREKAAVVRL